jgi:ribonuclease VapC
MVETSALAAIILEEEDWQTLAQQIADADAATTCVAVFETSLALVRELGVAPTEALEIAEAAAASLGVQILAASPEMMPLAALARERYGAGRSGLNMGDCLSYAAARSWQARMIYKGNDFTKTDVND